MSIAGLQVFLDDGILQIDSNFKTIAPTYRLSFTGPYTDDGNTAFIGSWYQFVITVPADVKYLYFASTVDRTIALFKKSGTTHTYRTNVQGTIEVYGFKESPPQAKSKFGMQLFDENGNLTFDSNTKTMKIAGAVVLPTSGVEIQSFPVTGRIYAVGLGVYAKQWRGAAAAGIPWGILMSYAVRVGPTSGGGGLVAIASRPTGSAGDSPPSTTPLSAPPTALIVDVTGL